MDHHRDDNSVQKDEGFMEDSNGINIRNPTTKGWSLLIKRKGGSQPWIALKDMKESNPNEVAK